MTKNESQRVPLSLLFIMIMWNLPQTNLNKEKATDFLIQNNQKENFQMSEIPLRP